MNQLALNFSNRKNPLSQTQGANLHRVRSGIAPFILEFFAARKVGDKFHNSDLWQFITAEKRHRCAPGSPDRIMRDLAQAGVIDYVVISRSESLYQITKLPEVAQAEFRPPGRDSLCPSGAALVSTMPAPSGDI